MNNEILEPISQRGSGAETAENRRIHEVANELIRRCQLYEAKLRNGQEHVTLTPLELEQRAAEQYAKEHGVWLPFS